MVTPVVSVLLPCRNVAATLPECLDSILAQTLSNFEVLAVDDGSNDTTADLLRSYCQQDKRIRYLLNPGSGIVDALNFGLQQANTELIARMDGDDIMPTQRLALQVAAMQQDPDLELLAGRASLFPQECIQAGYKEYMRWQNGCLTHEQIQQDIYIESPFAHPSVTFRRDSIVQLGGYRKGAFPEDYDLWLRLHQANMKMAKLDTVLLEWRDSPERLSRTDSRCSRLAFDKLRVKYLIKDPRFTPHKNNFVIWGAGRKTRKRAAHLLEAGFTPKAWIDIDPNKIGNRVSGIPVLAAETLDHEEHPFVLCYVTNHGARDQIASQLKEYGYSVGRDFLMIG